MNKNHFLAALGVILLSACGGGSSGSSSPQTPAPETPPPSPEPEPTGAVFADSPYIYSTLAVASFESLLQLGFLAENLVTQDKPTFDGIERSCTNGGIIQTDYSESDSAGLQAGEKVTVSLQECSRAEVDDVISGTIAIDVISVDAMQQKFQLVVDFSDAEIGTRVPLLIDSDISVGLNRQATSTTLNIESVNTLTISDEEGLTIVFDDVQINHVRNKQSAKYSLSGSAKVLESEVIDSFNVIINEPFVGFFSEFPHEGMMTLSSDVSEDLTIEANFVEKSQFFDITLDGQTEIFPWWEVVEGAIWSFDGRTTGYVESFRSDNFSAIGSNAGDNGNFPLIGSVEYYFSRPVDAIGKENFKFEAWGYDSVEADVEINGAIVTVTPSRPLEAGKEYSLSDFLVYTAGGQSAWTNSVNVVGSTDATAIITSSSTFIKPNDVPVLVAEAVFVNGDDIASVTWLDTDDAGLTFVSQGEAQTELDLSAVDNSVTELSVAAEVTSTKGLIAYSHITISVVPDSDAVLAYTSQSGDYIGGGNTKVVNAADGALTLSYSEEENYLNVDFDGGDSSWNLDLASASDEKLTTGKYEGATRWPFQSPTMPGLDFSASGRGCNQSYGEFEIFELEISGAGVERLAVDWVQHCESEDAPMLQGSLRYHTTYPLTL